MSKQAKRERQRVNRELARRERERLVRRARLVRTLRISAVLLVVVAIGVVAFAFLTRGDNDKKVAEKDKSTNLYEATITTNFGDIVVELDGDQDPKGVDQFVKLANEKFYDGLIFHRVVKDFVIQTGDPSGDGTGGSGTKGVGTGPPNDAYETGSVAYAKAGNEPAFTFDSQFFIVTGKPDALNQALAQNQGYAYLGKVTKGLEVAKQIEQLPSEPPEDGKPTQEAKVVTVTVKKIDGSSSTSSTSTSTPATGDSTTTSAPSESTTTTATP